MAAAQRHTAHTSPSAAVISPGDRLEPVRRHTVVVVLVAVVGAGADVVGVDVVGSMPVDGAASSDEQPATITSAATNHARDIGDTVGVSVTLVPATCESCGAVDDQLYAVRRRYVTPAEWDTPARDVTLPDVEQWCFSCCTHYPHELAEV